MDIHQLKFAAHRSLLPLYSIVENPIKVYEEDISNLNIMYAAAESDKRLAIIAFPDYVESLIVKLFEVENETLIQYVMSLKNDGILYATSTSDSAHYKIPKYINKSNGVKRLYTARMFDIMPITEFIKQYPLNWPNIFATLLDGKEFVPIENTITKLIDDIEVLKESEADINTLLVQFAQNPSTNHILVLKSSTLLFKGVTENIQGGKYVEK